MNSPSSQIIDLYRRHADTFAKKRGQHGMERGWLDRFLSCLPASPDILDIGCGTGAPIARYLAQQGAKITGTDSAPEMLAHAQQNLPQGEWIEADMRALDLSRQFDGIIAWNSFFHLTPDDQHKMFPIFRQHARPGAALMFTSGTHLGDALGCFEGETLYHGSLDPETYRSLLDANGFDVIHHVVEDPTCGKHTIWLAQCRGE